jgi:hypothetical protein
MTFKLFLLFFEGCCFNRCDDILAVILLFRGYTFGKGIVSLFLYRTLLFREDMLTEGCLVLVVILYRNVISRLHERLGLIRIGDSIDGLLLHLRALTLGFEHLINELRLALELIERIFGSLLLALFLRETVTTAATDTFQENLITEDGVAVLVLASFDKLKLELHLVLLRPFDELAT